MNEMKIFIDALVNDAEVPVGVEDAVEASKIAVAAKLSAEQGRPVRLSEIGSSRTAKQLQARLEPVK